MTLKKWLAMLLIVTLTIPMLSILIPTHEKTSDNTASDSTISYSNSDLVSLWVRRNGSDVGFPYGGANVSPSYGMAYFGTKTIQTTWDYNFSDISSTLFPEDCEIYMQGAYDPAFYTNLADFAVSDWIATGNQRIRGAFIDDFEIGLQSGANMSAIYTALHHEDGVLIEHNLSLAIVVYNRNYMIQTPYTWADINSYYDIIHFWYYPFRYQLLYNGLIGYQDDFEYLHDYLAPGKAYWLGIYLHYYNIGSYPTNFTMEQLAIAGTLIKKGYAIMLSILENFWIQHNPETSDIVKDFVNDEIQRKYTSTWYWGTTTITSYSDGISILPKKITELSSPSMIYGNPYEPFVPDPYTPESWTFISSVLQILTIRNCEADTLLYNMRTGDWQFGIHDYLNGSSVYILEPFQKYRAVERHMDLWTINGNTTYTTPTSWDNKLITISGMITVNNTNLSIQNCIIRFGNPVTNNSMYYQTEPWYGLTIGTHNVKLFITETIIEPEYRAYPYHFDRPYSAFDDESEIVISHSIIAGYSYRFRPAGNIYITNTTFFQVQPLTGNYPASIWLECPSYISLLFFNDNTIWNWYGSNIIGAFLMVYNLPSLHTSYDIPLPGPPGYTPTDHFSVYDHFKFNGNTIIGGAYALWIDETYSDNIEIVGFSSYASTGDPTFTTFRLDGASTKLVLIHTYSIFNWSVKGSIPGPTLMINYPYLDNGVYTLETDTDSQNIAVSTNTLTLSNGDWRAYRNNYTLYLWSSFSISTAQTFTNLIWLLFIFIAPVAMTQVAPKIGYIFGMILMLLVVSFQDPSFLPYMFLGMLTTGIVIFKMR